MSTEHLAVEHGTFLGRPAVKFRERPGGRVVYRLASHDGAHEVARGAIALAFLAGEGRWYYVRADGSTSPRGPWLGWLLDLAREHGWEP